MLEQKGSSDHEANEDQMAGQELKLIIGGSEPMPKKFDTSLIKLITKAHLLKHELQTGEVTSIKEFAKKFALGHGDAKNLIPITYLAPSIYRINPRRHPTI